MPKQSSFRILEGCFLKATGFKPRLFREGAGPSSFGRGNCGQGLALPTSLPASEAEKEKKMNIIWVFYTMFDFSPFLPHFKYCEIMNF